MHKNLFILLAVIIAMGFCCKFFTTPLTAEEPYSSEGNGSDIIEPSADVSAANDDSIEPVEPEALVYVCPKCSAESQEAGNCESCGIDLVLKGETPPPDPQPDVPESPSDESRED